MDNMPYVVLGLLLIVLGYIAFMLVRLSRFAAAARAAAASTKPYNRPAKSANHHVLVLGDSTMYGAGTKDREHTISGLLAAKYPASSIETYARNGARVKDVQAQLDEAAYPHYSLLVIGVGGNDIVRFSSYASVERNLAALLQSASKVADKIILCHCVNVGNIGFFTFPLNYLFDYRSRTLSQVYATVASKFPRVRYVNFYRPMHDDHYDKQTRPQFIADDAFHPNEYANHYFFDLIWKEIEKP